MVSRGRVGYPQPMWIPLA